MLSQNKCLFLLWNVKVAVVVLDLRQTETNHWHVGLIYLIWFVGCKNSQDKDTFVKFMNLLTCELWDMTKNITILRLGIFMIWKNFLFSCWWLVRQPRERNSSFDSIKSFHKVFFQQCFDDSQTKHNWDKNNFISWFNHILTGRDFPDVKTF